MFSHVPLSDDLPIIYFILCFVYKNKNNEVNNTGIKVNTVQVLLVDPPATCTTSLQRSPLQHVL